MSLRTFGLTAAAALLVGAAAPAMAQDSSSVPMNTYRTGPFGRTTLGRKNECRSRD